MPVQTTTPPAIIAPATIISRTSDAQEIPVASAETFALLWCAMDSTQRRRTHQLFNRLVGMPTDPEVVGDMRSYASYLLTSGYRYAAAMVAGLFAGQGISISGCDQAINVSDVLNVTAKDCTAILNGADGKTTIKRATSRAEALEIGEALLHAEAKKCIRVRMFRTVHGSEEANGGTVEFFNVEIRDSRTKEWSDWPEAFVHIYIAD